MRIYIYIENILVVVVSLEEIWGDRMQVGSIFIRWSVCCVVYELRVYSSGHYRCGAILLTRRRENFKLISIYRMQSVTPINNVFLSWFMNMLIRWFRDAQSMARTKLTSTRWSIMRQIKATETDASQNCCGTRKCLRKLPSPVHEICFPMPIYPARRRKKIVRIFIFHVSAFVCVSMCVCLSWRCGTSVRQR